MHGNGGAEAGFLRIIGPFLTQASNCRTLKGHPRSSRELQTPVVEGKAEANFIRTTGKWGGRDGSEARACSSRGPARHLITICHSSSECSEVLFWTP